jgi:uncharacterized protein YkwD
MRQANVRFVTAGENLALAPSLQIAHTGLMNSPGHRANILHRDFGRVGIGIMDRNVSRIYKEHYTIDSISELEKALLSVIENKLK